MTQPTRLAVPVSARDHSQGPASAAVTLVQYGDYECPYTRQATWVVQAIQQPLGGRLRFIFRNFPLVELHPHALHAALAAEAAAAQGKFWQMHDSIVQGGKRNGDHREPDGEEHGRETQYQHRRNERALAIVAV